MIGDSRDERVLCTVASALAAIDELGDLTMFQMPYPDLVQRALDQIVLHCLRRQARPPMSVPGLVRWGYERPLGMWPLALPEDIYPTDEYLVDVESGAPTALCHEIALCAESDNPLWETSRQVSKIAGLAAERGQPHAFSTLRNVLMKYPVLTTELFNEVRFSQRLGVLDECLGDFYRQIGAGYETEGEVVSCARCGTPLRPIAEDSWWCEREECLQQGPVSPGHRLEWDARVMIQLDRRHRQFVLGPNRAVLRLAENLAMPGVTVQRWPVDGTCDLRVGMSDKHTWNVNVVDWHSPALLGRAIRAAVSRWGVHTATWVVAQYRVDAAPDYPRIVREHAAEVENLTVLSEKEFTNMVSRLCEEDRRA